MNGANRRRQALTVLRPGARGTALPSIIPTRRDMEQTTHEARGNHGAATLDHGISYREVLAKKTVKFAAPLTFFDAQQFLYDVLARLCAVFPSIDLFQQALVLQQETKYSFYDSLIIAGVLQAGCETLYSEDLQHGQQIRAVRILNHFASS